MINCPNCEASIPENQINTGQLHPCPGCRSLLRADAYSALLRDATKDISGEDLQDNHQAECFFHPGKKAVAPCESCGRMLCSLCQVELNGQNICLNCLQIGKKKQKISTLQNGRVLYDSIALILVIWPLTLILLPFYHFTFITAPLSVYFSIKHFRTPSYVLPKKWAKAIIALVLAIGIITAWTVLFISLFV